MDQAKAIINLKEGLLELEGPVDFVREYINRFSAKGLRSLPKEGTTVEERVSRGKKRRRTAVKAVRAEARAGFFDQPRSIGETKTRLAEKGVDFSKNSVRIGLNRLIQAGLLSRTGAARNARYQSTTGQSPETPAQP